MKEKSLHKCPNCASETLIEKYYSTNQINLSFCKKCEAIFQNPRISEMDYDDVNLESKELKKKQTFYGCYKGAPEIKSIKEFYKKFFKQLKSECTSKTLQKKHLDVGCATGLIMSIAKELSFQTYGIEISKFTAEKAKEFGEVFVGTVEKYNTTKKFDIISCISVMEHLPYPLESIRCMLDLLAEGGIIGIEIPVNELKRIRIQQLLVTKDIPIPQGHLFQFNPGNLKKMFSYLDGVDVSFEYFGIISNKDCRHAYVREEVLNRPLIKLVIFLLDKMPIVERLFQLEFFSRIKIRKIKLQSG